MKFEQLGDMDVVNIKNVFIADRGLQWPHVPGENGGGTRWS